MRVHSRKIVKGYVVSLAGAGTTTIEVPIYDLSHAISLTGILKITGAAADATDTLDVELQDTNDRVTWNTRARFARITGAMAASAGAPQVREFNLMAEMTTLNATGTEAAYTTTGSAGGADLAAGSVRNGPILGGVRTAAGWAPSHRVLFIVTQGNAAAFAGTFDLLMSAPG